MLPSHMEMIIDLVNALSWGRGLGGCAKLITCLCEIQAQYILQPKNHAHRFQIWGIFRAIVTRSTSVITKRIIMGSMRLLVPKKCSFLLAMD